MFLNLLIVSIEPLNILANEKSSALKLGRRNFNELPWLESSFLSNIIYRFVWGVKRKSFISNKFKGPIGLFTAFDPVQLAAFFAIFKWFRLRNIDGLSMDHHP